MNLAASTGRVVHRAQLYEKVEKLEADVERLTKMSDRQAAAIATLVSLLVAHGILTDDVFDETLTRAIERVKVIKAGNPGLSG